MANSPIPTSMLEGIRYEDASGDVKVQVVSSNEHIEEEYHVHSRVVNWYSNYFSQVDRSQQDAVILQVPSGARSSDYERFFQLMYDSPLLIRSSQCMQTMVLAHHLQCPYLLEKSMWLLSMIPWERGHEKIILALEEQGVKLSVALRERLAPFPEPDRKSLFEDLCRSCDFSCEAAREVLWQSRGRRFCSIFDEALQGELRGLLSGSDAPKLLGITLLASRTQMFHLYPDLLHSVFTKLSNVLELAYSPENIDEFLKAIAGILMVFSVGGVVLDNSHRCKFCIKLLEVLMSIKKETLEQLTDDQDLLRVSQKCLIKVVGSLPHSYRKLVIVKWMQLYSNIRWPNLICLVHEYTS